MPNVTIYLPGEIERRVRKAAKAEGTSVSRWIATRVSSVVENSWSPKFIAAAGADPDFPEIDEISYGADSPRENL